MRHLTLSPLVLLACWVGVAVTQEEPQLYQKYVSDGSKVTVRRQTPAQEEATEGEEFERLETVLSREDGTTAVVGKWVWPKALRILDAEVWGLGCGLLVQTTDAHRVHALLFSTGKESGFVDRVRILDFALQRRQIVRAKITPTANGAYILIEFTDTRTDLYHWSPYPGPDPKWPSASKRLLVWRGKESDLLEGKGGFQVKRPGPKAGSAPKVK